MITVSASKLKTFTTCPRQYYNEYVLRAAKKRHPAAALGSSVHKAIEVYYTEAKEPTIVYMMAWQKEMEEYPELRDVNNLHKLHREGMDMIQLYDFDNRPVPKHVELGFELPYKGKVILRGIMDQVHDWGFTDLKSGKNKPQQGVLDWDLQFVMYAHVFQELYGEFPKAYWYHLRTGQDIMANVKGKEGYLEFHIGRFVQTIEDYEKSGDPEVFFRSVGFTCSFCSHREYCLGS